VSEGVLNSQVVRNVPAALAAVLLAVAAVWGLQSVLSGLHNSWTAIYGPFAHGYLILALALWLGWRLWQRDGDVPIAPDWRAAVLLLGLLLALALMELLFINSARQTLLPLILSSAIWLVFGRVAAQRLLWPAAFLYFALPQWWAINGLMQALTTGVVNVMVSLSGVPAYIDGNFFLLPAGVVEIASGCSGLNYLMVGLALAAFQGLMYLQTWRSRLLLAAAAVFVALVSNWLRVFALILIAYATDMQHYLIRVDHLYFGWVVFMVLMWPVLRYGSRLEMRELARSGSTANESRAPSPGTATNWGLLRAATCAALLLLLPRIVIAETDEVSSVSPLPEPLLPGLVTMVPLAAWSPVLANAIQDRVAYQWRGFAIEVFRAAYSRQSFVGFATSKENDLFGRQWRGGPERLSSLRLGDTVKVRDFEGTFGAQRYVVLSWYQIAGRAENTRIGAKFAGVRGLLSGRRDVAVVAVARVCEPDCSAARRDLESLMLEAMPSLSAALPARSGR